MTDKTLPLGLTLPSGVERMFPTLTSAQLERVAAHGRVRSIHTGELLVEPGQQIVPFYVLGQVK
jgi:thioredoxin reductase (NADPH)